jgi:hypothetical protein
VSVDGGKFGELAKYQATATATSTATAVEKVADEVLMSEVRVIVDWK